jgi:CRP/FNR family transcriptional regulator, nitrogen oxide reductase regulator
MAVASVRAASRPLRQLRESGFLAECGPAVDEMRWACPAVVLPAGPRRTAADLPAARMLVVEEGVVLLRAAGSPGRRSMIMARCSAGAILPPPGPGDFLQALTDGWLTAVGPDAWGRFLESPAIAERLLAGLEETVQRQRDAARALAGVRHVDRVRKQLLDLAAEHGRVCRDGVLLDLPLTHDLIADMVGCARETVTRSFEELQRAGFLRRRGRFYQILVAPEALAS